MFKFIKNLAKAIRCAVMWVQALDHASLRQNKEAKEKLIKIARILKKTNIEYCLLRGYIEHCLNDYGESRKFLDMAVDRLEIEKSYSTDDLYYMKVYAHELINCHTYQQNISIEIDYSILNLEKVSNHLKEKFPISAYPKA